MQLHVGTSVLNIQSNTVSGSIVVHHILIVEFLNHFLNRFLRLHLHEHFPFDPINLYGGDVQWCELQVFCDEIVNVFIPQLANSTNVDEEIAFPQRIHGCGWGLDPRNKLYTPQITFDFTVYTIANSSILRLSSLTAHR